MREKNSSVARWENEREFGDVLGFYLLDLVQDITKDQGSNQVSETERKKIELDSPQVKEAIDQGGLAEYISDWANRNHVPLDRSKIVTHVEDFFLELKEKYQG